MSDQSVSAYIEGLYESSKTTKKQYAQATEMQNYGQVVDDDVARMLQVLITVARPQKALEIGTSIGFSTMMMAKAMKPYGGRIVTIELDEKVANQAIKNFQRQGVSEQIEVLIGDAQDIVAGLAQDFDLIFQDVGDKTLYAKMLDSYPKLLKTGGMLLAEDVLFPVFDFSGDASYLNAMREPLDMFNRKIAESSCFESTLLPIGDGLMVAVKR